MVIFQQDNQHMWDKRNDTCMYEWIDRQNMLIDWLTDWLIDWLSPGALEEEDLYVTAEEVRRMKREQRQQRHDSCGNSSTVHYTTCGNSSTVQYNTCGNSSTVQHMW